MQLRELFPGREIHLVARQGVGGFLVDQGWIDQLFEIEKSSGASYKNLVRRIQSVSYHRIYCPHPSLRSALLARRLCAELRVGFRRFWNFPFFDLRIQKRKGLPEPLRVIGLLEGEFNSVTGVLADLEKRNLNRVHEDGSLPQVPLSFAFPSFKFRGEARDSSRAQNQIAIFPTSTWLTKAWPADRFADLARGLSRQGYKVVWLGSAQEKEFIDGLVQQVPGSISMAGQLSVVETLHFLGTCLIAVCNDSGGQHLASLAGTPVISIFGPTVLAQGFRPWTDRAMVVENRKVSCRPCGAHGHQRCPLGTHECMNSISVGEVESAVARLLSRLQSPSH